MMWIFPLAAMVVSLVFAFNIGHQWFSRRKPHQLAWYIALLMFAVASGAAAVGMYAGWTPTWFRLYFIFGAIINVPVLALGTVYVLGYRRVGNVLAIIVGALCLFSIGYVFAGHLNTEPLSLHGRIPRARDVLPNNALLLARYMSFTGFFVVVGGALWSAWKLARRKEEHLRQLAKANILIAVGTSIVAAGSGFASLGSAGSAIFSVGLLLGVSMMFFGFLKTRATAVPPVESAVPPVEREATPPVEP